MLLRRPLRLLLPWGRGVPRSRLLALLLFVALGLPAKVVGEPSDVPLPQRTLRVGGDQDFPPYEFVDRNGEPAGFDVELFEAVAQAMDLKVVLELGPWEETRRRLEEGQLDAVVGMHYSAERDEKLDFSTPYAMANYSIFVRDGERDLRDVRDLAGRRVVVQAGALVHDMAEQLDIEDRLVTVRSPEDAVRQLAAGEHDAALLFRHQGLYLASKLGIDNLRVVGRALSPRDYCFAVVDGDEELLRALNEGLAVVKATGRYQAIQDKWLGVLEPRGWSWRRALRLAAWIVVPSLFLLALAVIQAWILRRRVRQRTQQLEEELVERRRAEAALVQEHERLLVTLRSIADAVVTTDADGRVELMNRVAERLLGMSLVETRGLHLDEVLPLRSPSGDLRLPSIAERVLRGQGLPVLEHVARLEAGGSPLVDIGAAPIIGNDGEQLGVVVALRDITAQRRMEEELARAEKLDSVGLLAGGIAHDFNNILTGVLGHVSLARQLLEPDHLGQGHLTKAEAATHRAQGLTQQLLTFSKGGTPERRPIDLGRLLAEAVDLSLAGSTVRPELRVALDLWSVEADSGQLVQVVHNLLLNASQAQPQGGSVRIQASNERLGAEHPSGLAPGSYVRVCFHDDGPGISPELEAEIFEPFFTTKHSGSGLGLTTAYSITQQHQGWLGLDRLAGPGACFVLLLPACPGRQPEPSMPRETVCAGEGRVLVMDDEQIVREVLEAMLTTLGYGVTLVEEGQAAVDAFTEAAEAGEPYAVVIMDLTVPGGMGGVEAMACIRKAHPHARGIVSSGFSDDPVLADPEGYGFCATVAKPFRLAQLSTAIERVLSSGGLT